ncbi:MAG: rod shape-determining protein MreC [Acidimicrobiia bacterium]|nr:rod shape-determining protein MreC [Acidimicrobiia bacterium]
MASSRRTGRSRFTLILLILTSITLVTLDYSGFQPFDRAREGALDLFAPVRDGTGVVVSPVSDAWNGAFGYGDLEAENEQLRQRIDELEGTVSDAERDRDMLREILGDLNIPYVDDLAETKARVVAGPIGNFQQNVVTIDKGTADGIAVDMSVVTPQGFVGVVTRTGEGRSEVRLVTHPEFRVGVQLTGSGTIGVARGQGRDQDLIVDQGIEPDTVIDVGELVTTSGQDRSRFPADLKIGEVSAFDLPEGELDQNVFVEPLADLDSLSFVTVLLWEPPA